MDETLQNIPESASIIDDDLVAFFDLLARFDFEDKQKEVSALKTGSLPQSPAGGGQF